MEMDGDKGDAPRRPSRFVVHTFIPPNVLFRAFLPKKSVPEKQK
jgi:hypothetical protein